MSRASASPPTSPSPPTEASPEVFAIVHNRWQDVVLAEVEHWVEDGDHVVRAVDFDLIAIGDSCEEAMRRFIRDYYDLGNALRQLVVDDEATHDEVHLFVKLSQPIIAAHQKNEEDRERRLISVSFPRLQRRGQHRRGDWGLQSHRAKSVHT